MNNIAGVYILESPYHIDRIYHYYIPSELSERVVPGAMVEVPFGNGNRRMTAAVYEITSAADTEELKPIMSAADVFPPYLSEEALKMCSFLKEHTLCTFGEAVKCVLPSAAVSTISESYRLCPDHDADNVEKALFSLGEKAAFIYTALSGVKKLTKENLRSRFGEDVTNILAKMIKLGIVEKCDVFRQGGSNIRQIITSYPCDEKLSQIKDIKIKSERQSHVLKLICESPGISVKELSEKTGYDDTVVKGAVSALEKKEYIYTVRENVYRNPFSQSKNELNEYSKPFTLSAEQEKALNKLTELYCDSAPRAALLHGVTGSGKTNVMLKLIEKAVSDGKSVIMLVPEIALTPQTVGRFISRFGDKIAVIHSALSAGERFDAWRRIRTGEASVVIGTRSAIFAPVKNLGLIIIDEEHEHTYKSDTNPKYHTSEVASYRCGETGATLVLASATPSITSYHKAVTGKYTLIELKERYGSSKLPEVEISDMRRELSSGNQTPFSRALISRIGEELTAGNQTILFLNRRGYNSALSCRSCGEAIKCPHCSVTMTYHLSKGTSLPREAEAGEGYFELRQKRGYLHCHTCGYKAKLPKSCPECGASHFMFTGCGTQLAENELKRLYPNVRILRMDHDTTRGKCAHEELLESFRRGEADILLGTQMVSKGHDFPRVTTVGVLNADSSMFLDDYRASERTFSMLTQVIGRAGRSDKSGVSFIQTFNPDSDIIALASKQDYRAFYENEIRIRKSLTFPPFCDIAVITLSSADEAVLGRAAIRMSERIRAHIREDFTDIKAVIYGPFEAPVYKVQNICRLRFVIKCRLGRRSRSFIGTLLEEFSRNGNNSRGSSPVRVSADFNPGSI